MTDERPSVLIEVPPLGDLGRQRIRQAVFERLEAESPGSPDGRTDVSIRRHSWRQRRAMIAAAAALVLVVGATALWRPRGETQVSIGEQPAPVSRVVTLDAPSRLTIADADVIVAPRSAMTFFETPAGVHIVLERGEVDCAVAPRNGRPPFVVLAADVRVEVVGTRFTVAREGDAVRVTVSKGVVRVVRAGDESLVPAGQRWPEPEPPAVAPPAAQPERPFGAKPALTPRGERTKVRERRSRAPTAAPQPSPSEQATGHPDARERFEAAARLESARPNEAAAMYRRLASESGAWAAPALFAQARLALDRGDRPGARRLLESYLHRYPSGANAGMARTLLGKLD
jgi:hypothetical protein